MQITNVKSSIGGESNYPVVFSTQGTFPFGVGGGGWEKTFGDGGGQEGANRGLSD